MNRLKGKVITLSAWWENGAYETKRGYTPKTVEDKAVFRVGPFCVAWEVWEEN